MQSFLRIVLLLAFATAGVALAVGMATQEGPWTTIADRFAEAEPDETESSTDEQPEEESAEAAAPTPAAPNSEEPAPHPAKADAVFQPLTIEGRAVGQPHSQVASRQPTPAQLAPHPPIAQQHSATEEALREMRELSKSNTEASIRLLEGTTKMVSSLIEQSAKATQPDPPQPAAPPVHRVAQAAPAPIDQQGVETSVPNSDDGPLVSIDNEGDGQLVINIRDTDIREVLKLLGEQGGLNILTTKNVTGNVATLSMQGVDVLSAMDAILKSNGFLAHREGEFVYVGTPEDFENRRRMTEVVGTRVYRPNYATAAEIQALVTPLLTNDIGSISISSAAEVGIPPDSSSTGGDNFAGLETIVIRDYESVLNEVDAVVREVDQQPLQVAIEAMILSVRLNDTNNLGVNFEALLDNDKIRLISGSPPASLASIDVNDGGLKFGFMDSNLNLFIEALETIGDANVIASPRLTCLNKQKAQILIGAQRGYVSTTVTETSTTQSVEFLEVGTQLRIRPFISSDGMIRMEVHPELSTGEVQLRGGFTLPEKEVTEVTTNIMCQDGRTIIIGGLIREELSTTGSQIPLLGSLPYLGAAFRQTTEEVERREIIILITPRIIYEPAAGKRADKAAREFHHRQAVYADSMSPIGKRALGRKYFRLAQLAWERGDCKAAMRFINHSIMIDPERRAAIDLRSDIAAGVPHGDHTDPLPLPYPPRHPLDGERIAPWLIEELGRQEGHPGRMPHPVEPGKPGQIKQLAPQEPHK